MSTFKEQWEAKKLLKKSRKKAVKNLLKRGYTDKEARSSVKRALSRISKDTNVDV
jgi:hypothetical protein